jgi:hypothetical protein
MLQDPRIPWCSTKESTFWPNSTRRSDEMSRQIKEYLPEFYVAKETLVLSGPERPQNSIARMPESSFVHAAGVVDK